MVKSNSKKDEVRQGKIWGLSIHNKVHAQNSCSFTNYSFTKNEPFLLKAMRFAEESWKLEKASLFNYPFFLHQVHKNYIWSILH